jgi:nitrate reductase / nitrite oxidoreductase, alpha subunit
MKPYESVENGDWKFLMWDAGDNRPKMPQGSSGLRWGIEPGKWNLLLQDGLDGSPIQTALRFLENSDEVAQVSFDDFGEGKNLLRGVPAKRIETRTGEAVLVATVYDLLMAQYGVARRLGGQHPTGYDDEDAPYTPAWQEKYTGMGRDVLIRFAREWGTTAELTRGKCMIIIGAGINHWYHKNLMYRAGIHALMFCGCVGVNGGGMAHYVGQEKLAPAESWSAIAVCPT